MAVSGVAGPGGGSALKPVGMVCLAWGGPGTALRTKTLQLPGDRDAVRRQTVVAALQAILKLAQEL